jgi:N-acetylmuramoyl-L-alanine amidase/putative methionine-R-sulfoxide reductase with GAF domain
MENVAEPMSATPSNAGAAWSGPNLVPGPGSKDNDGRNALQALLAFACIHQQATQRRSQDPSNRLRGTTPKISRDEFGLNEVLELVAQRALSITGSDGVAVALADDNAIICRASAGEIAPQPGVKLDPNSGFSGACLRSGQTIRCDDSETDSRVNAEACRTLGARSMIAVPLSAKQRVIGLIEAFSKEAYGFNDSDVRSLNLLGELILAAIRPEEEDRLAEISRKIVVPEPARLSNETEVLAQPKSARLIVDEKFSPLPARTATESVKLEAPPEPEPIQEETKQANASAEQIRESFSVAATFLAQHALPAPKELEAPGQLPGRRSVAGIALIAASVLVAIGLGWVILQKIRHGEQAISANTQTPVAIKTNNTQSAEILPTMPVAKPGATPQVTGIRQWAAGNSSVVVIDLEDQVQYEDRTLENPPRIYFDLHDTKIAPALLNQSSDVANDPFLKRIRVAQPIEGTTRVVLETNGDVGYSLRLDSNPYRLTIDLHKRESPAGTVSTPPLPKPSPGIAGKRKAGSAAIATPTEFRIALDAGHGGWDLGTVGKKGLLEKDLVLDIVERLGKLIETNLDAKVIYTRQDDSYLPLEKRAEVANLAGADLFLSVHANYSDLSTARGVETYYTNTYSSVRARTDGDDPQLKQVDWTGVDIRAKVTDSHRFAAVVQQALYGALAARNPDIRNRGVKKAEYVVLTGTQMPAVLAEVSFVSSPADEDKLRSADYRQQIAEALYKGVAKYHSDAKPTKIASARKTLN